jgi:hypothetical protein
VDWIRCRRSSSRRDIYARSLTDASLPRQFHFANIYRADVYNVLVAEGFGTPTTFFPPEPLFPRETVPVRDSYQAHQTGAVGLRSRGATSTDSPRDQTEEYLQEPIVSESTPFFHVDLVAAVQAAVKLGLKAEEEESETGEDGQNRGSRGDILIDLQN